MPNFNLAGSIFNYLDDISVLNHVLQFPRQEIYQMISCNIQKNQGSDLLITIFSKTKKKTKKKHFHLPLTAKTSRHVRATRIQIQIHRFSSLLSNGKEKRARPGKIRRITRDSIPRRAPFVRVGCVRRTTNLARRGSMRNQRTNRPIRETKQG